MGTRSGCKVKRRFRYEDLKRVYVLLLLREKARGQTSPYRSARSSRVPAAFIQQKEIIPANTATQALIGQQRRKQSQKLGRGLPTTSLIEPHHAPHGDHQLKISPPALSCPPQVAPDILLLLVRPITTGPALHARSSTNLDTEPTLVFNSLTFYFYLANQLLPPFVRAHRTDCESGTCYAGNSL